MNLIGKLVEEEVHVEIEMQVVEEKVDVEDMEREGCRAGRRAFGFCGGFVSVTNPAAVYSRMEI